MKRAKQRKYSATGQERRRFRLDVERLRRLRKCRQTATPTETGDKMTPF